MLKLGQFCSKILLAAVSIAYLSGCQQMGGMYDKLTKKSPAPSQSQIAKQNWTKPLKPEEKIDVQMAVAHSLVAQGENNQAIKVYQEIIKKDSKRADAYHQLALLYDKKGDAQSSEKYYRLALKKDPKNATLLADYGYSCYLQERWKESEQNLRQALALDPEFARAHNNLGLLLARTGREEEALKEFARTGANEAEARSNLGFALLQANHWANAKEQFQIALAADPESKKAKEGLSTLQKLAPQIQTQEASNVADQGEVKTAQASFIAPK
jgi:Tfp pilus assembly protein PilF